MAIAFDAAVAQQDNSTSTQTISHTCTGSNLLLLVGFITNNTTDIITGVTYASVAMTRQQEQASNDNGFRNYVYSLLGPATGTNDVVVSASSASLLWTSVISYSGVSQTGFPDAKVSGTGEDTNWSRSHTTVADNSWVYAHLRGGAAITFSSPDTERADAGQGSAGDSNAAVTPAGAYTINGTIGDATNNIIISLSFAPATAAGPANLKSYNTNLKANIKSIDTNLIANIKSIDTNV